MANELITNVAIRLAEEKFANHCYDIFLFGFETELDKQVRLIRDISISTEAEQAFAKSYRYRYAEYVGVNVEEFDAMAQAFAGDTGNPDALMASLDRLLIIILYTALFTMIEKYSGEFPAFRDDVPNYKFIKIINRALIPYTTGDNHFAKLVEVFSKFQYLVVQNDKHLKMTEDDIKDWVVDNVGLMIKEKTMATVLKPGDKVYFPSRDGKIHTLMENTELDSGKTYPVALRDEHNIRTTCFTADGKISDEHLTRELFLATEENRQKLMDLHGIYLEPAE